MTQVYIIRHAEAEGNIYRRMCGQYNGKLTKLGVQQLDSLEKRFEGVHIDKVYYSDLERTRHTSTAVTRSRNIESVPERGLREVYAGTWEYIDFGTIAREFPEDFKNFAINPAKCFMEGGETFEQVQKRMVEAVLRLAAENDGKTIALFSHAYAIRSLAAHIQGIPSERIREVNRHDNTSVTLINVENGKMEMVYDGDSSHLRAEDKRPARPNYFNDKGVDEMDLRMVPSADGMYAEAFRGCERVGIVEIDMAKYAENEAGLLKNVDVDREWQRKSCAPQLVGYAVAKSREAGMKWLFAETEKGSYIESYLEKFGFEVKGEAEGKSLLGLYIELEPIEIGGTNAKKNTL